MDHKKLWVAIGTMSGTSADGIDVSLIVTNGIDQLHLTPLTYSLAYNSNEQKDILSFSKQVFQYKPHTRKQINSYFSDSVRYLGRMITEKHQLSIEKFLYYHFQLSIHDELRHQCDLWSVLRYAPAFIAYCYAHDIDINDIVGCVVGFHGQTIYHNPAISLTYQLGSASQLAHALRSKVVFRFRNNDMRNGGQGAPLAPLFHWMLLKQTFDGNNNNTNHINETAILNVGGIANITFSPSCTLPNKLIAFDTGPGNTLLDRYAHLLFNCACDKDGNFASNGLSGAQMTQNWSHLFRSHPYFYTSLPKSADRWEFEDFVQKIFKKDSLKKDFSPTNWMLALINMTVYGVKESLKAIEQFCHQAIRTVIVCGGGRFNKTLMSVLQTNLSKVKVLSSDTIPNWQGTYIESQVFGFLAVRSLLQLPISFPYTTGVPDPIAGGVCVY